MVLGGVAIGTAVGLGLATKIAMTAMPQLVALFNGMGGGASTLVAGAYLASEQTRNAGATTDVMIATAASGLIGTVTLSGSTIFSR